MANKAFIYDQFGDVQRIVHAEDRSRFGDDFTIQTVHDVEPLLDHIRTLRDNHKERGDMKHVASVPVVIYEQSIREGWDQADWNRWLNDPDNKHFRVWEGRV